jgi:hypothetical protein
MIKSAQFWEELHASALHFFQLLETAPEEDALGILAIARYVLQPAAESAIGFSPTTCSAKKYLVKRACHQRNLRAWPSILPVLRLPDRLGAGCSLFGEFFGFVGGDLAFALGFCLGDLIFRAFQFIGLQPARVLDGFLVGNFLIAHFFRPPTILTAGVGTLGSGGVGS